MKKGLIIFGAVAGFLLTILVAAPLLFKSQIQKIVDDSIAESVNAEVTYRDFGLSLLRNFPNLSVTVDDLSIVGVEQFAGDTLLAANEFAISVNLYKAIFSDRLTIKNVYLDQPLIQIKVLEDGSPNYDISVASDSVVTEESSEYDLGIQGWEINQGTLVYDDRLTKFYVKANKVNHTGSGDFTQDLFDLTTETETEVESLQYDELEYLQNKLIEGSITLEMDLPQSKYTFKDNRISINQFAFGFDGWLSMPEGTEDIGLNLSFETLQNEFKALLSCVPGMYSEGFENIETGGEVTLKGNIDGVYNETSIPSFEVFLKVDEGTFKYPDLPTAVEHINLDMAISNQDGIVENTLIDIKTMHLDFGENPLDGSLRVDGLATPEILADVNAILDLGQLTSMFPMDDTELRGSYSISLKADGRYDSVAQIFPIVDATMSLENGFVKSSEFPESIENFHFSSSISNTTGKLPDTRVEIPDFSFVIDGEPFGGRLTIVDFNDYTWDMAIEGGVNLEKVTHIFSFEDMILLGTVRGSLASKGSMSSLEAERYADIPTSGTVEIKDFSYSSPELSHPFEITQGKTDFTPQQITLTDVQAKTGTTDLTINGAIVNYINYLFADNQAIKGSINLKSQNINLNEWMSESGSSDTTEDLTVIEVPSNLDLSLDATANTVYYDNMVLRNLKGQVLIKDGKVQLNDVAFNSLGGGFLIAGTYDPTTSMIPTFNMDVQMQQVAIKQAFESFNTVQTLAPVAQFLTGDFDTSFKLNGALKSDMMPQLGSLNLSGLVHVMAASLAATDSKLVQGITALTKFQDTPETFDLEDVIMAIKIKDGKMDVAPFEAKFGDYTTQISGSTGIDGSVEFLLNMDVPAGIVGTSINQALANLTNSDRPVDDKVKLNLRLSGTYDNPQFGLGGIQDQSTTAGMAKSAVDQKSQEVKDSAKVVVNQQIEKATKSASKQLDSLISDQVSDSTSAEAIKDVAKDLLDDKNVEGVLNIFKKRKPEKDTTNTK